MGCGGCPGGQTEASAPTECNKKCGGAGRCGERIERRRRRMKRDERVAAVKILSVRRKAARKFWAPQQDHRPLRVHNKRCGVKRNPPVTASPCQPPLGKGAEGTGTADCHSQCAHWPRNDRGARGRVVREADTYGSGTRRATQIKGGPAGRPYGFYIHFLYTLCGVLRRINLPGAGVYPCRPTRCGPRPEAFPGRWLFPPDKSRCGVRPGSPGPGL